VDDVELGALLDDHLDRRREPAARVALDPGRSKRTVDGRDELARDVRIAAGEHRHVVPALNQLRGQLMDDALRAAIRRGRDALNRGRDLRDPEAAHGGSHQLRQIPKRTSTVTCPPWVAVEATADRVALPLFAARCRLAPAYRA